MSFHNDPWDAPDAYEQDAPERWERAEQVEREDEAAQDRLTRDVPARRLSERGSTESGHSEADASSVLAPGGSPTHDEPPAKLPPRSESRPRPDYDPRVDHPERYMRDGVYQVDV